ncbi:MAG: UbiD family decarboxylase [Desulfuromonadaceae bacterium]|nr:UbiD family decarboxylase [Desulfuromonadaceae bacterium]
MPLREHIHQLSKLGDVAHIRHEVDADIDLSTQAYRRMCARATELTWFHHVKDTTCSVIANLFATTEKIEQLLSNAGLSLAQRLNALPLHILTWTDFSAYVRAEYAEVAAHHDVDTTVYAELGSLYELPMVRYWEGDSHPYFSLATLFSQARGAVETNAGIYRLATVGPRTLTVNWRAGSRAYTVWQDYASQAERMPVTIALGVDPALTFASMFPLPESGSELSFWGFIRAQPQQVDTNSYGLPLPQGAEVLLQGYVEPSQLLHEGSYANHTGFYTQSDLCPVIHIEKIHMHYDAIVPVTVVGPPPTESALLGAQVWSLLTVLLRRECPFILAVVCPQETSHLPVVIVQVSTPNTEQIWGLWRNTILNHSILGRTHTLILVDEATDCADFRHIYWHCMNQEVACYSVPRPSLRVIDGVCWRFNGRKKVERTC